MALVFSENCYFLLCERSSTFIYYLIITKLPEIVNTNDSLDKFENQLNWVSNTGVMALVFSEKCHFLPCEHSSTFIHYLIFTKLAQIVNINESSNEFENQLNWFSNTGVMALVFFEKCCFLPCEHSKICRDD